MKLKGKIIQISCDGGAATGKSTGAKIIAKKYKIRHILKLYQTNFAKKNINCCIEGRDISTKILPNSDVKFFFKCNLNTAALRRYKELKKIKKMSNLRMSKKP